MRRRPPETSSGARRRRKRRVCRCRASLQQDTQPTMATGCPGFGISMQTARHFSSAKMRSEGSEIFRRRSPRATPGRSKAWNPRNRNNTISNHTFARGRSDTIARNKHTVTMHRHRGKGTGVRRTIGCNNSHVQRESQAQPKFLRRRGHLYLRPKNACVAL